jgi:DUF917 family protein
MALSQEVCGGFIEQIRFRANYSLAQTKKWVVEHTISLSWRIGRAVAQARKSNQIDNVAESIIQEVGGQAAAKVLFKGKIVGCDRTLRMGHVYGEVIIEGLHVNSNISDETKQYRGKMKIPFKNEYIAAYQIHEDDSETVGSPTHVPQFEIISH